MHVDRTRAGLLPTRARPFAACSATTIVLLMTLLAGSTASATVGSPVNAGRVVVTDASVSSRELTQGRSATQFTLRLPPGAGCPGDSANDQWRVQSFIVPSTDDPGALRYAEVAPAGDGRYALYDVFTAPFVHILTDANSGPGRPGVISPLPALSFAVFPPGTLPAGRYRIGIACTLFRETAKYWDTEIVITQSPGDEPGQLTWRLAAVPAVIASSDQGSNQWLLPSVGVLGAAALGLLLWRRSTHTSTTPLSKEPQ